MRSYSTEPQIWGGSPDCPHMLEDAPLASQSRGGAAADASAKTTLNGGHGHNPGSKYWEPTPAKRPMTGGSDPASATQVTNAGSQFGNAWAEQSWRVNNRHAHAVRAGLEERGGIGGADTEAHRTNPVDWNAHAATCTRCGAWRGELGSEPVHSCGQRESGLVELRSDLTDEERAYVIQELQRAGLL